jgi:AcrR family transcriptional regulator
VISTPLRPKTPRARRHDANLLRILDCAMDLVAAEGLAALSMGRLAEAASYTPGALYRYFGSKDALLSKLVARILEDLAASLGRAEARLPSSASPLARVFLLVQGYRAFARQEPHRFGLLATTMADPRVLLDKPEDAAPVVSAMIAALQPLAEALGAAAEAGVLDAGDRFERTVCLFALLQGALQLHKQSRYAPGVLDVDRLTVRGARSLLLGWGAKARTVDAAISRIAALAVRSDRPGGEA